MLINLNKINSCFAKKYCLLAKSRVYIVVTHAVSIDSCSDKNIHKHRPTKYRDSLCSHSLNIPSCFLLISPFLFASVVSTRPVYICVILVTRATVVQSNLFFKLTLYIPIVNMWQIDYGVWESIFSPLILTLTGGFPLKHFMDIN